MSDDATAQPFTLVPSPPGTAGLHYTDTHLLACGACKATITDDVMAHDPACDWIGQIRDTAARTERIRELITAAVDRFEHDTASTRPELYPARLLELRDRLSDAADPASCTCPDDCELEH